MNYETAVPIGRGASGEVFRAHDPVRGREVAIKLFPPDDGASDARRLREAEAQARLHHPSICEIYEVGTNPSGRGFIAMRYVDGEPLDEVAARLPLRERVLLVRDVADALACAHEAGLIHRDLKPSNLLVEEQPDGGLRPFVLDFGIVHVADETRLTETGQVLGTPGYLSPEQARGATEVDARSDVFSLGVVLWQVLTGELPFQATSTVGALMAVLEEEPRLAHQVNPEVPAALAHIAARCLEKDPRRRYADAGALRRDLDRHLDAGVVSARGIGPLGRFVRRVERRPAPWALGMLLALVLAGSLLWTVRNRFVAQQRTSAAERFARISADLESQLRFLEMLPARDLSPHVGELEAALADLAEEVEEADGRARAAGQFAVGRAEMALGRPREAIDRLRSARRLGFDDPAGALALGRALVEAAREELRAVDSIGDPEVREAERSRLRADLRSEALPLLRDAAAAGVELGGGPRLMAEAMAALLMDELVGARAILDAASEEAPWLYEAELLRADSHYEESVAARLEDELEVALQALDRQQEALERAASLAPSSARAHLRLCAAELLRGEVEAERNGPLEEWDASFRRALENCERSRSIRPDLREVRLLGVEVRWRHARRLLRWRGSAALGGLLDEAIAEARELAAGDRTDGGTPAALHLGNALYTQALARRDLGEPVLPVLEEAIEALEQGVRQSPGRAVAWQSLGIAWSLRGVYEETEGVDPRPSYRRAMDAYAGGLTGSELQRSRMLNAICATRNNIAYYGVSHPGTSNEDEIDEVLEDARVACRQALELDPDLVSAMSNLGLGWWTAVEWAVARGESPLPASRQGRAVFAELLETSPEHVSGRNNLAGMIAATTRWQLDREDGPVDGEAVLEAVAEGRAAAEPLRERIPADILLHLTRLAVHEAAARCLRSGDAAETAAAWRRARSVADELVALDSVAVQTGARVVELHRRAAECLLRSGRSGEGLRELDAGERALERYLPIDDTFVETVEEQRRLAALRARHGHGAGVRTGGS